MRAEAGVHLAFMWRQQGKSQFFVWHRVE